VAARKPQVNGLVQSSVRSLIARLQGTRRVPPTILSRRLPRVGAEAGLHVPAYNLQRVIKIMGTGTLIEALRA
jgi:hypothetical protein